MRVLLIIVALCLTGCKPDPEPIEAAAMPMARNSTLYTDVLPPDRFKGDVRATVIFVQPELLQARCAPYLPPVPAEYVIEACVVDGVMILPNPCALRTISLFDQLACHEIGHLNGWPGTHGD